MKPLLIMLILGIVSISVTSIMVINGYSPLAYVSTNILIGGVLGYIGGHLEKI